MTETDYGKRSIGGVWTPGVPESKMDSFAEWIQLYDSKSQHMYYYNRVSGHTQWEQPPIFQPLAVVVLPSTKSSSSLSPTSPAYVPGNPYLSFSSSHTNSSSHYHNSHATTHGTAGSMMAMNEGLVQQSMGEKRPSLRWQIGQIKETEPLDTSSDKLNQSYDLESDDEGNTSGEEEVEEYCGSSRRCWGRPNRSMTLEDLDDSCSTSSVPSTGRFRTISSIDQQSLMALASYANSARSSPTPDKRACSPSGDPPSPPTPQQTRGRANTTNSIYVSSTMTDPDASEELACISAVIHAHMVQFLLVPSHAQGCHPKYRMFDEDYESTEERDVASSERLRRPESSGRQASISSKVPHRDTILEFVKDVYGKAQMEKECLIMSFAYLERLLKATRGKLMLNQKNWKAIVLSTMILASKVWDDLSMWNVDFSLICPSFTLKRINEWEICLLEAMKYEVRVSSSQYAKYYFQLRAVRSALGISSSVVSSTNHASSYAAAFSSSSSSSSSTIGASTRPSSSHESRQGEQHVPSRRRCNTALGEFLKRTDSFHA